MDTDQELEYVLAVPVDQARTLRDKLMLVGAPERSIRMTEPTSARSSRSTRRLSSNGCDHGQSLHVKSYVRFLPDIIKLGTYAEDQNVTIRRRLSAEGRVTVCVSMYPRSATTTQDEQLQFAAVDQSRSSGNYSGDGGDNDDGSAIICLCRCDGAECENDRKRLCEYLANNGTSDCGDHGTTECVNKRIIDALQLAVINACAADISYADTANPTPIPEAVSLDVKECDVTADIRKATADVIWTDDRAYRKKQSLMNRLWRTVQNAIRLPYRRYDMAAQAKVKNQESIKLLPLKTAILSPLDNCRT
ncbi:Hypothetical protein CINCED_3A020883 [Cinara cedri]|uniref:Uncharacterized protein n=1 Tax=Cinara cedri TaxID=506608 RepID=A0A5E4M4P6_9HEMI|nr:Hypothetical protein CINCED_3A020883 [Cinara cedri]